MSGAMKLNFERVREERIFPAFDPKDEWAYLMAQFTTWESAFRFAFLEAFTWDRRMMVMRTNGIDRQWLVYPANKPGLGRPC